MQGFPDSSIQYSEFTEIYERRGNVPTSASFEWISSYLKGNKM